MMVQVVFKRFFWHIRKLLLEFREHARQHVDARSLICGNHQFAARRTFQLIDGILRTLTQFQNLLRVVRENTSRRREGNSCR